MSSKQTATTRIKKTVVMLLAMVLVLSAASPSTVFANGGPEVSVISEALEGIENAIPLIGGLAPGAQQAAINDVLININSVVGQINAITATTNATIESANGAIETARLAAERVSAANTAAGTALADAGANEADFDNFFAQSFFVGLTAAEVNELVNLVNATTVAWNAYANAQNHANALANTAAEAIGTDATVAQVQTAIAEAEAAQAAANALFQAWLNAEANLQQNSAIAAEAAPRQQTRYNAATAHKAAVAALAAEADALIAAQTAIDNANTANLADIQATVAGYTTQLNNLIALIGAFDGQTVTIPGGGTGAGGTFQVASPEAEAMQQNPQPALPPHYAYTTAVRRILFRPDMITSTWPAHIPRNMLQWNNAITLLVNGSSQSSTGNGAGQVTGNQDIAVLAEGQRFMILGTSGQPTRFNYAQGILNATILIEITFYCNVNGWTTQNFWAAGYLYNDEGGTVRIESLVPAEDTTITLTVSETNPLTPPSNLEEPGDFEFGLGDLFMATAHYLTDPPPQPPTLTGTVTCVETSRPIPGVTIYLYDNEGNVIDYRVTDSNGFFDFGEVPVGELVVRKDYGTIPEGYVVDGTYNRAFTTVPGSPHEEHFRVRPPETEQPTTTEPPTTEPTTTQPPADGNGGDDTTEEPTTEPATTQPTTTQPPTTQPTTTQPVTILPDLPHEGPIVDYALLSRPTPPTVQTPPPPPTTVPLNVPEQANGRVNPQTSDNISLTWTVIPATVVMLSMGALLMLGKLNKKKQA